MKISISNIQIHPILPREGLVAFASFVLDDCLFLSSIGIMTRPQGGYRLTYPTKQTCNKDIGIFYPIRLDFGKEIESHVIKKYLQISGEINAAS